MVMKILILIFFFEIKESKIPRGHNITLVKKQSRFENFHFPRGPSMYGINYQHSVYMLVVLTKTLPSEVFLGWQSY